MLNKISKLSVNKQVNKIFFDDIFTLINMFKIKYDLIWIFHHTDFGDPYSKDILLGAADPIECRETASRPTESVSSPPEEPPKESKVSEIIY